jgi:hypothetical protein
MAPTGALLPPPPLFVEVVLALEDVLVVVEDIVADEVVLVVVTADVDAAEEGEPLTPVGELSRISWPANCELSQLKRVKMLFGSVLVAQKKVTQYGYCAW